MGRDGVVSGSESLAGRPFLCYSPNADGGGGPRLSWLRG